MLKERRRLVLMPRETPLSLIQIENMAAVTRAGRDRAAGDARLLQPAAHASTTSSTSWSAKALDHLGVPHRLLARWGEHARPARDAAA